jgi:hypothetical protein
MHPIGLFINQEYSQIVEKQTSTMLLYQSDTQLKDYGWLEILGEQHGDNKVTLDLQAVTLAESSIMQLFQI